MADLIVPSAPALVTVPDVELCAAGTWAASTGITTFTLDDLHDCVAALDCPGVRNPILKLGHTEADGAGLRWDGEPAIGWIANMRLSDDAKIVGDYTGMPGWLAGVLPSAYPDRSVEMYRPFTCQIGHVHPAVIGAVALLGVSQPGVGVLRSLQDVAALYGVQAAAKTKAQTVALRHGDTVYLTTVTAAAEPPAPVGGRPMTDDEIASGMDPAAIDATWSGAVANLLAAWPPIATAWAGALAEQITAAVDDGDLAALGRLQLDSLAAQQLLADQMVQVARTSAEQMVAEAASQGVQVQAPDPDEEHLGAVAAVVAALLATGLASAAGRDALRRTSTSSVGADVAEAVSGYLDGLSDSALRSQLGGAVSSAQAAGRFAVLGEAPETDRLIASEVLDRNSCTPCRDIDGHEFDDVDEARAAYPEGLYIACLGGLRCRGTVFGLWS